jgi:aldehyde:ferredoxin oxidoreductase
MNQHHDKNEKVFGWRGKILRVDLSTSRIWEENLPQEYMDEYIGGAGINARLLYDLMHDDPCADALAPGNPFIIGCGPLVGTRFPCTSRFTVTAKSPLTGIFGDSNAGGWFPVRLKQAGYDHIIIQGKAGKHSALLIEPGKTPQIVDAGNIWGLDTYAADKKLHEIYGDCETLRIGPAGENLVRYANILSGTRRTSTNGRTGMGCVMGSKNLKAIIIKVDEHLSPVPTADEKATNKLAKYYRDVWLKGPGTTLKRQYGTLTNFSQIAEHTRVKNEQEPLTKEQLDAYDLDLFTGTFKTGQTACYGCPVACSQKWEIKEGPYKGDTGDKVEYGHLLSLGPNIGIFDFSDMLHFADISNRMGLDCIQFGYNMATAMECFQRGILNSEELGGIQLGWGNAAAIEKLLFQTARREGFGILLAESARDMAARIGPDAVQYGSHTKGMSFPFSCTYALPMSLASSVATRGGDHLKGHPFASIIGHTEMLEKMFGSDVPPEAGDHTSPVAKGRVVWWQENYKMVMDCIGLCFLPVINSNVWCDPLIMIKEMGEMYQTITGRDAHDLFTSAERAYQIERCFNALQGMDRKDDTRIGTLRGEKNPINLPGMLDEYYEYRGCSQNGLPTRKRLQEIGMADVAEDLARHNKLSNTVLPAIEELIRDSYDSMD